MTNENRVLVSILMGSESDWGVMRHVGQTLEPFAVPHESRVLSAHRSPELVVEHVRSAAGRGVEVIVAGAGGAAHLAGVVAAHTPLPVLGVPLKGWALDGMDALLSTVQMPRGVPVGTLAIGKAGAVNAALLAVRILALSRPDLRSALEDFHRRQSQAVAEITLP
ncbi:MAG: 5-(carboxyamino)imidazole ribonucleotide mutase [Acidobacteria bacterium]|nr:MAG: 5-(carboxyamino)imidazole ribonucleotide mutase [Acidobacteriota bacterium]